MFYAEVSASRAAKEARLSLVCKSAHKSGRPAGSNSSGRHFLSFAHKQAPPQRSVTQQPAALSPTAFGGRPKVAREGPKERTRCERSQQPAANNERGVCDELEIETHVVARSPLDIRLWNGARSSGAVEDLRPHRVL